LNIAASGASEASDGDWRRYELRQARTFALSLSPDYIVTQQTVGNVTLIGYAFSYHAAAGQASLKTTAEALETYSRLFGPYPHRTLAVVEADFLDGMEYDGLFFLSNGFYNLYHGTPGEYLIALAAHETAHQWWFGRVGSDQALEPWLDEALCTYSERLYYENLAPSGLDWWLQVRVMYYKPRGFVDDTIYNPQHEPQAYRAYRDAVYLNGALFLQDLRELIGDEAFFAALQDYSTRFDGKLATSADFFAIVREHTQVELSPLVQKYFSTPR
jgi:aminopeptidase N